jgi:hypothetical protein
MQVWIDRAAVVLYECRSLERTLVSHEVLMSTEVDPRPVDAAEQVEQSLNQLVVSSMPSGRLAAAGTAS